MTPLDKVKFRESGATLVIDLRADLVTTRTRETLRRNTFSCRAENAHSSQAVIVGPDKPLALSETSKLLLIDCIEPIQIAIGQTQFTVHRQFCNMGTFPEVVIHSNVEQRINVVQC